MLIRNGQMMTREAFAERAGLSMRTIQQFELGALESPTNRTKAKLAKTYGLSREQVESYAIGDYRTKVQKEM